MHGTTSSVGLSGRFRSQVTAEPEPAWRPWVRLLDMALDSAGDAEWLRAVPDIAAAGSLGAPLLHEMTLAVDARRARKLLRELLREAERIQTDSAEPGDASTSVSWEPPNDTGRSPRRRLDVLGILRGAITHDMDSIARAAAAACINPHRLAAVAQLAIIPVLHACAMRHRERVPEDWLHGYCPVCGAWPTLAEVRGLERNRRLRCGRCSTDWPIPVLRCPFCNELHHDNLHALLPEGDEQIRRVDVCETCKGYIKGFSTLQPLTLRGIALADLTTVELDIVAQERGYERPSKAAYPLSVSVVRASAPPASRPS